MVARNLICGPGSDCFSFISGQTYGGMKANAVKLSEKQFPEFYEIIKRLSREMNLNEVPDAFLIPEGGVINAFSTLLYFRRNYVVFYAAVVEVAYREGDFDSLEFIAAHELRNVKAGHVTLLYNLLIFPGNYSAWEKQYRQPTCLRLNRQNSGNSFS